MTITAQRLQKLIFSWFDQHGRKHLPWQQHKTPYRIWVSEIMLQQTQVITVIPYFERFMQQFPDLMALATAHEDAVLHAFAGLGYYSRARNLHRAAKMLVAQKKDFPCTLEALLALPGIGLSTAGAILAIAFNQPAAILDGNVKRVLARFHGITQAINEKTVEAELWQLAIRYTPKKRVADYTQAMMDLGATLCTRSKPNCTHCPLAIACVAYAKGLTAIIPQKKKASPLPTRAATFLILKKGSHILLQKRAARGIWGGLWCLPEMEGEPEKKRLRLFCQQHFATVLTTFAALTPFRHTFSHYHLMLHPVVITLEKRRSIPMDYTREIWYNLQQPDTVGLPKPIQLIMSELQ